MHLAELLGLVVNAVLISIYIYVAYTDFSRFKITNSAVLGLLACFIVAQINVGFAGLLPNLLTAALLFTITFPFWLARVLGAGDVKLLAATGLVIGIDEVFELAVLILTFSVLMLIAISYARYVLFIPTALNRRLGEILQNGKVPYGVPVSLAAIFILAMRLGAPW